MIPPVKKEQDNYYVSIEYHLQELNKIENKYKEDIKLAEKLKKENNELRNKIKDLLKELK
jgi:hypothetical protein